MLENKEYERVQRNKNRYFESLTTTRKLLDDLWAFTENGGDSAEFFALRERIRNLRAD